jgi:hypothetical protein
MVYAIRKTAARQARAKRSATSVDLKNESHDPRSHSKKLRNRPQKEHESRSSFQPYTKKNILILIKSNLYLHASCLINKDFKQLDHSHHILTRLNGSSFDKIRCKKYLSGWKVVFDGGEGQSLVRTGWLAPAY